MSFEEIKKDLAYYNIFLPILLIGCIFIIYFEHVKNNYELYTQLYAYKGFIKESS